MTESRPFSVEQADHVGFAVPSLEDALAFWVEGLGARLLRTGQMQGAFLSEVTGAPDTSVDIAVVEIANQRIELLEYACTSNIDYAPPPYASGILHLALQVSDIEAVIHTAARYGWMAQGSHPQTIPGGPKAGTRVMYIVGPAGQTIELMQPPASDT